MEAFGFMATFRLALREHRSFSRCTSIVNKIFSHLNFNFFFFFLLSYANCSHNPILSLR